MRRSRRQALDHPRGVITATVAKPIVQAIVALLPELDVLHGNAKSAPIRWHWQVAIAKLLLQLADTLLEGRAAFDRLALRRCQRAELARARSAAHVGL